MMNEDTNISGNTASPKSFLSFLKRFGRWDIAVLLLLAILSVFLIVRASDEYRWSDWGFGDAQSMLSLKQWNEEGWYNNYFLFIPQGHAKAVRALDEEPLRHHAHGTCPGSAPGVGPRLWYTHYPAGYLVPYALLFKIGLEDIFPVRTLSVVFSIAAVALMYILFSKIVNPQIAAFTVIFYIFSPVFLGYADTIANQPLDDLLRFGFMLAIVLAGRSTDKQREKRWLLAAWLMEFALSLSSFDSVFFVYVWLIGWDLIDGKGFRWRRYLLFSLAPLIAHSLQLLQNVWYLGWETAVLDVKVTFLQKAGTISQYGDVGGGRLEVIMAAMLSVFASIYKPFWMPLVLAGLYLLFRLFRLARTDEKLPSIGLLLLLFVAGLAYIVVLPHGARMPYQGRQMLPFVSLTVGALSWAFIAMVGHGMKGTHEEGKGSGFRPVLLAWLVVSSLFLVVFWYRFVTQDRKPVYGLPADRDMGFMQEQINMGNFQYMSPAFLLKEDINFIRQLLLLKTTYDTVYFDAGGFRSFWDPNYVPGFPQINPIVEFYAASRPVLCFVNPESIVADMEYLLRKKGPRFSPVLITDDSDKLDKVLSGLHQRNLLKPAPFAVQSGMNRYIVDLTPYINWESL